MAGLGLGLLGKIKWFSAAVRATKVFKALRFIGTIALIASGVKGFMQMRDMMNQHQSIMANKTAAGGKIPVIYGTRRVGSQIVFMDTVGRKNRDLYVVYALAVGECEEILGKTIEIGGNSILDEKIFKKGGYVGSDKITSGAGSLCTADQNGDTNAGVGGGLGTDPTKRYQFVFNLHHGADSQTADPMLRASIPSQWSTNHKLNGICYIAAHFHYSKTGVFQGVPQITVQVRGKKVYDPRESGHTFGDPSTYEWSSNPALCYLDYITNDSYGKGLAESDINMSTFESAADVCDVEVDQPYYNGAYQNVTWSGTSGDDFIVISDNDDWYQNKTDEVFDLRDNGGTNVFTGAGITGVQRHQFYDDDQVNKIFINESLTSTYTNEAGSARAKVKRFHCNGYIDTNRTVMDNAKELVSNMRGIFTYINGKYELQIEDTGTSTFSITEDHIISGTGISIDYGDKDKKANKVIVEFYNSQTGYELDTATVLHDASPEYYSDDGEILEIKAQFPLITDAYIAYNMGKAILTRSRNQMTMQFLGTPEMYKLNVGDIVDLTYAGLGLNGKVCRIEALELQSDGLVNVSLIEYFDVYTWEVPAQEEVKKLQKLPSKGAVHPPEATSIVFTDTDASAINRPTLTWTEPDDFDVKEFRVDVVDSSDNNVFSKIVDTPSVDLSFLPKASNYEASITSFNTLDVESEPVTKTFTIADDPVKTTEVAISGENLSNVIDYGTIAGGGNQNFFQIKTRLDLEDRFLWNSNGDNYWALGTAGDDDVNLKIEGGANTLIQFKDQDNELGTVKLAFGDDVIGNYSHDFINLVADYTQGNHATDAKSIFYIKGNASDGDEASGDIAKFTFAAADGYGFPTSVLYGTTTTPILIAEDYIEIEQATAPSTTTDKLYNVSGVLHWNGSQVGVGAVNSVTNMVDNRVLTASGTNSINGEANLIFDGSTLTVTGDQVITGDLAVQGTTTTIDTTNLDVKDKNITLNYGTGDTSANADGAGITIQDAVSSTEDATILWTTANDTFNFSHPVSVTGNITSSNTVTSQSINVNSSGYGVIEVGGVSGAYIDLKRPNTDDYDLRLITDGTGGVIDTGSGELTLKRQGSTKIATTSTGIDVTGAINSTGTGRAIQVNGTTRINSVGDIIGTSYYIGSTNIIDTSANLTNIGTINSGAITATGTTTLSGLTVDGAAAIEHADSTAYSDSPTWTAQTFDTLQVYNDNGGSAGENHFASIYMRADGSGNAAARIILRNDDSGNGRLYFQMRSGSHTNETKPKMLITDDGQVAISDNATTYNERLFVDGNLRVEGVYKSGTQTIIDASRNLTNIGTISSGAITSTGLTVDGNGKFSGTTPILRFTETDTTDLNTRFAHGGGFFFISTENDAESSNTPRLAIDHSTGDVGIGLTNPSAYGKFVINGTSNQLAINASSGKSRIALFEGGTGRFYIDTLNGSDGLAFVDGDGSSERMRLDSSGDLTMQGGRIYLKESDLGNNAVAITRDADEGYLQLFSSGSKTVQLRGNGDSYINGGNFGIGTIPARQFHVHDASASYLHLTNNTTGSTGSDGASISMAGTSLQISNRENGVLQMYTNGTERMRIDSSGNAIFTKSGGAYLQLKDASAVRGAINVETSDGLVFTTGSSFAERMRIDSSGNLIVGGTTAQQTSAVTLTPGGSIINDGFIRPATDASYDIGSSSNRYQDLHLSGNIATGTISVDGDITLTEGDKIKTSESSGGSHLLLRSDNLGVTSNSLSLIGVNDVLIGAKSNQTGTGNIYFGYNAENKASGSGWVDTLTILDSGNVGINTTNPTADLSVGSTSTSSGDVHLRTTKTAFSITPSNTDAGGILLDLGWVSGGQGAMKFGIGGSEKARIDSSGNLLVGTTDNFNAQFASYKDGGSFAYLGHSNTGGTFPKVSALSFGSNAVSFTHSTNGGTNALRGSAQIAAIQSASSNAPTDMAFYTTAGGSVAERMRIDSSGNVGIGITPSAWASTFTGLQVSSSVLYNNNDNDTFLGANYFYDGSNNKYINSSYATAYGQVDGQHIWYTASSGTAGNTVSFSEAMRIDSSGNLLVSKTSSDLTTDGIELRDTGGIVAIRTNGDPLYLNRKSTDGAIATFAKDGSTIGSIGTYSSRMYIGTGDTGLQFLSTADNIIPINPSTPANRDAAIDLGASGVRFKDLHLSGTGYFGTSVGIGTTSPDTLLHLRGADTAVIRLENSDTSLTANQIIGGLEFEKTDGSGAGVGVVGGLRMYSEGVVGESTYLTLSTSSSSTNNVERMRIDSSGRVGIGTTSPATTLTVAGSSANGIELDRNGADATQSARLFFDSSTSGYALMNVAGSLTFNSGSTAGSSSGTERMRIDSLGNLLVGKTSSGSNTVGFETSSNGQSISTTSGASSLILNRKTSDGTIADFRKDGSIIGSIGSRSGALYIENPNNLYTGLDFSNNNILPRKSGSLDTGGVSLGASGYKFKNLYLSGDINADGDISTNELVVDTIATIDGELTSGAITVAPSDNDGITIRSTSDSHTGFLYFGDISNSTVGAISYDHFTDAMRFKVNAAERMRLDSSGNLLVGTASETSWETTKGFRTRQSGSTTITRDGNPPLYINRLTSDGVVMVLKRGTTTKGQMGILDSIATSTVYFASGNSSSTGTGLKFVAAAGANNVLPCRGDGTSVDNVIDLGSSATRFDDIYATNGTIQTSDRNEKQDIQKLSDAEQRVAVACKGLIRRYKFNSAVAEKGDNARYHFGIIAQDLQDVFTAEGLNASDYGMFISETWTDEEGNEQTRLGVRYNELLAFIIATL